MKSFDIKKIIEIGRAGFCSHIDMLSFLPNFPTLLGSEPIFTIGWASAKKFINSEVAFFVKGLHCIELAYRNANHGFGFGSPSPSYMVIEQIRKKSDTATADELRDWILTNGGNYYIKPQFGEESTKVLGL